MKDNKQVTIKLLNALTGIDVDAEPNPLDIDDTYEVMCQFDDDLPVFIAKNIPINHDFKLVFKAPTENDTQNFIEFVDKATNKKIKIFTKRQNKP